MLIEHHSLWRNVGSKVSDTYSDYFKKKFPIFSNPLHLLQFKREKASDAGNIPEEILEAGFEEQTFLPAFL